MRLICPNCGAQYEVPAEVIPAMGRDVQCSNCGQTWFQEHPDYLADMDEATEEALEDEEHVRSGEAPVPGAHAGADDHDTHDTGRQPDSAFDDEAIVDDTFDDTPGPEPRQAPTADDDPHPVARAEDAADHDATATPAPARRELDPAVANVLRAEAELEAQARRRETVLESQPDLGLPETIDDAERRSREARDRMARIRGNEPADDDDGDDGELLTAAATGMGTRRNLLPDIEEINSTLRSNSDRSPASDPGQTAQIEIAEKRSSRLGFSLTVALVAVLALVYAFAPQLAETVPQAAPALESYVSMVDGWRAWLDTQVAAVLSWLDQAADASAQ